MKDSSNKQTRYVLVDGQKVYLNQEQQKAWDKMINDVRNEARRRGSCGQPNYHLCFGDCEQCPWYRQGRIEGYLEGNTADGNLITSANAGSMSMEQALCYQDTVDRLLQYARNAEVQGEEILRMRLLDEMPIRQIASELGLSKTVVERRLHRMLTYIRTHADHFFS